jgi:hypothetical protein
MDHDGSRVRCGTSEKHRATHEFGGLKAEEWDMELLKRTGKTMVPSYPHRMIKVI